jgi:Kef-type K+ transport system membrane component KefB
MKRRLIVGAVVVVVCGTLLYGAQSVWAEGEGGESAGHALDPFVLAGLAVMLIAAKLGGELFERIKQPAVLGELIVGILIGNLALFGFTAAEPLKTNEIINALAEIGVIILLFEVGLESNLGEMLEVGWSSLFVALAGVVAPFLLGWAVAAYFIPETSRLVHFFIGATLCATSVGITARVLKDIGHLQTRESRIILGAAVIDDVLGLVILAVVAGAIKASAAGAVLSLMDVAVIAGKAVAFLFGAIAVGRYITPRIFRRAGRLEVRGVLLALSVAFCFLLAWAAARVGLAPIVGAFAAGLVLDDVHFETFEERGKHDLQRLIAPVGAVLVPIFFVLMGMKVDLRAFARVELLGFAAALTVVAIIGKQICSLVVVERGLNRVAIGLGMIPRGEVGLIFAGIGAALVLPNAQGVSEPVIDAGVFGVIVIMVIVTTLVTPPALKRSLARTPRSEEDEAANAMRETAEQPAERTSQ